MEEDIWKKNMEEKYVFEPVFYDVSLLRTWESHTHCSLCSHVVAVEQIILNIKYIYIFSDAHWPLAVSMYMVECP